MIELASGVTLITASVGFLYGFIPREGAVTSRGEWTDISIAIGFSSGIAFGLSLVCFGFAGLWK